MMRRQVTGIVHNSAPWILMKNATNNTSTKIGGPSGRNNSSRQHSAAAAAHTTSTASAFIFQRRVCSFSSSTSPSTFATTATTGNDSGGGRSAEGSSSSSSGSNSDVLDKMPMHHVDLVSPAKELPLENGNDPTSKLSVVQSISSSPLAGMTTTTIEMEEEKDEAHTTVRTVTTTTTTTTSDPKPPPLPAPSLSDVVENGNPNSDTEFTCKTSEKGKHQNKNNTKTTSAATVSAPAGAAASSTTAAAVSVSEDGEYVLLNPFAPDFALHAPSVHHATASNLTAASQTRPPYSSSTATATVTTPNTAAAATVAPEVVRLCAEFLMDNCLSRRHGTGQRASNLFNERTNQNQHYIDKIPRIRRADIVRRALGASHERCAELPEVPQAETDPSIHNRILTDDRKGSKKDAAGKKNDDVVPKPTTTTSAAAVAAAVLSSCLARDVSHLAEDVLFIEFEDNSQARVPIYLCLQKYLFAKVLPRQMPISPTPLTNVNAIHRITYESFLAHENTSNTAQQLDEEAVKQVGKSQNKKGNGSGKSAAAGKGKKSAKGKTKPAPELEGGQDNNNNGSSTTAQLLQQRGTPEHYNALKRLALDGIIRVQQCGIGEEVAPRLAAAVSGGMAMPTLYGNSWHVTSQPLRGPVNNVAYTTDMLDLHQDLVYHESMPGIQLLHCQTFKNSVVGGNTFFLDAFHVCERFRAEHPQAFQLFTEVPVAFMKDDFDRPVPAQYYYATPHIHLNDRNEIIKVFWAPAFEAPLPLEGPLAKAYYHARAKFCDVLFQCKKDWLLSLRLLEGEAVIWQQVRLWHGRGSFTESEPRSRIFHGAYGNLDMFRSSVLAKAYLHNDQEGIAQIGNMLNRSVR